MTESHVPHHDPKRSAALFEEAQQYIPGGVNSPVRAFRGVGGTPLFFSGGQGAYLIDEDENRYVDFVGAWGPMILGHCHPSVIQALQLQLNKGLGYGASTAAEVEIAKTICKLVPSIEKVRLVTSGTEATMSAIRLARGYTRRDKVVKFEGCYHGHVDGLLVKAGSGALTLGEPDSLGVPTSYTDQTFVLTYNDIDGMRELFDQRGEEIACVIVEPVAGNMNLVPPVPGFLEAMRELCTKYGAVLIFDEVMTGFRTALGGAQSVYGVTPDLTTLGKVIGGGLPVGAFGGKAEIMNCIAPLGGVYQAGTLAGSPLAVAAGLAMLTEIQRPGFHDQLTARTAQMLAGLQELADAAGIPFTTNQVGGMFGCFFSEEEQVTRFDQVMACNVEQFKRYFHLMLENNIYLAPSAFEAGFVSAAHGDKEIELTLAAAKKAFAAL
ncbi:glutamate-1-semialdehyde 2,1-aminomutase [Pseudohongiella sp. SYSU M77423]|uniref:glutamate-1-semialdehyde 2,1-aminomutase n=1 Tax=unclassified Pseudohongiella TaxID=2629611 RepID=UPI000C97F293|nr:MULTISPECIES: glutamate-1-semialdehyde 2,1-aminomutase [unclassified Pseudohongiella]MAY55740.1 glutamate-1-semialdehyde-2,1-aminomutase [Gammaproteobacteria bacterium]MDH7944072.1 glutamate-1-semialdehyde 2,1-aminomutase [Pseudohongiella sp. SYSU M77423]MEC8861182.1 glutamate-1-semialdehyde 2,1-aminomutase [Pseudomonadota bacterium]HBN14831.1 glutamate-1-semialdehyde-2,1-aminomutase [Pseudohongiella sp.]|tara:strand:+ start:800 stop:2110 length:1311 start_codon:yes stop_codon:yes gene_type:complete